VLHNSMKDVWVIPENSLSVKRIKHHLISESHRVFKDSSGGTDRCLMRHIPDATHNERKLTAVFEKPQSDHHTKDTGDCRDNPPISFVLSFSADCKQKAKLQQ